MNQTTTRQAGDLDPHPQEIWAGRFARWLPSAVLVLLGLAAYSNCFTVPFLFDDDPGILGQSLVTTPDLNWGELLHNQTPVVTLTLWANYRLGGENVVGYHIVNLAIHLLAALVLFGIARRTFLSEPLRARFGRLARLLGLAVAAIWMLHPIQTQAVTYIIQRKESLMGLFYLLTLYSFIRGSTSLTAGAATARRNGRTVPATIWLLAGVVSCLLSAGCKPVAATAPLIVLIYDLGFLSDRRPMPRKQWLFLIAASLGFAAISLVAFVLVARKTQSEAWPWFFLGSGGAGLLTMACLLTPLRNRDAIRVRGWAYLLLAISWLWLGYAFMGRLQAEGLGGGHVTVADYASCQPGAVLHYLQLLFAPTGLCFDYGDLRGSWPWVTDVSQIRTATAVLAGMVIISLGVLARWPTWGFWLVWFFLILAPSSSVLVVQTELAGDYRVYLSLAGFAMLAVMIVQRLWQLLPASGGAGQGSLLEEARPVTLLAVLAVVLGVMTFIRNQTYASALSLWEDTASKEKAANNYRARNNYGRELLDAGAVEAAGKELKKALELNPADALTHNNIGLYFKLKADSETDPEIKLNLQQNFALLNFKKAIELKNDFPLAWHNRAAMYVVISEGLESRQEAHKKLTLALEDADEALRQKPRYVNALVTRGQIKQRLAKYAEEPKDVDRLNSEALADLNAAVSLAPGDLNTRVVRAEFFRLAAGDAEQEHLADLANKDYALALEDYDAALAINPKVALTLLNRGACYCALKQLDKGLADISAAIELNGRDPIAYYRRARYAWEPKGELTRALLDLEEAIKLKPNYGAAVELRKDIRAMLGLPPIEETPPPGSP